MTPITPVTYPVNGREGGGGVNRTPALSPSLVGASEWTQGEAIATPTAPLVTTSISQQDRLEVYPRSIKTKRPNTGNRAAIPPDRTGSNISGFSAKSRSNLRHQAENAFPALISQIGLTYQDDWPVNGRICKRHLNAFLNHVRRYLPGCGYLWILEFQKRNAPHFHIFLTVPVDPEIWDKLALAWVRIIGGSSQALWWHGSKRGENWISWDMHSSGYLTGYLSKEAQKTIPEGYHNFGRFWGCSTDLVKEPIIIPMDTLSAYDQIDQETGEVMTGEAYILRNLGRLAERKTNGYSRFRKRAPRGSYTMHDGTRAFFQIERYLSRITSKTKGGEKREIPLDTPF